MRFELTTPTLARLCSTPELRPLGALPYGANFLPSGEEAAQLAWDWRQGKYIARNNRAAWRCARLRGTKRSLPLGYALQYPIYAETPKRSRTKWPRNWD